MLDTGTLSAQAMFKNAEEANKVMTWILRFVGLIVMVIGLVLVFKPLSVLADVIPFVGSLVEAGAGLVSILIALIFSSLTIAVAWVFYRPVIGISLLAAALAVGVLLVVKMKKAGTA
jgi:polyferredoxin